MTLLPEPSPLVLLGVVKRHDGEIIEKLNLSDFPALLAAPPKKVCLKAYVKRNWALQAQVELLEICCSLFLGSCDHKVLVEACTPLEGDLVTYKTE